MEKNSDKRKEIDKLALKLLGPHMPNLRNEFLQFVPRPEKPDQKNETLWLLKLNLKQIHEHFLLFEDKMNEHSLLLEDKVGNSTDLQCTKVVNAGQNCSMFQVM